jgi:hypothetical protein
MAPSGRAFLAAALALLVTAPATATVLADWSLQDLVRRADLVVIGTVTAQEYVVDDKRKAVLTLSSVAVERTMMGKPVETFTLTQLGGRAGSVVTEVMGDAQLAVGDRVLLFTFAHDDDRRYLVGMALGAWQLAGPKEAPELRQRIDSPLASMDGSLRPAPGLRTATLDDVKAAIDAVASSGNAATSERLE